MCSNLFAAKPLRLAVDAADLFVSPETDVSGSNGFARSTLTRLDHHTTKKTEIFPQKEKITCPITYAKIIVSRFDKICTYLLGVLMRHSLSIVRRLHQVKSPKQGFI